jgi:hypothetical protein
MGFTPEKILGFLGGGRVGANSEEFSSPVQTEHERTTGADIQQRQNINRRFGQGALVAGSALGGMALARSLPGIVQQVAPQLAGQAPIQPQQAQQPTPGPQAQQAQAPTPAPIPAPASAQVTQIPAVQILTKMGIKEKVDAMLKSGNTPDAISAVLSAQGRSRGQTDPEMIKVITEYAQTKPLEKPPEIKPEAEIQGRQAVFPDGKIGTIESSKDGIAKVNVDGQIRHRNENDLTISPLPEKDLADLFNEMIAMIEKETGQEVSRHVEWAGYDPEAKELAYKPWNGEQYTFDEIEPEDIDTLNNFLSVRKTSGNSLIGAWEAGTKSPIGSAMHALVEKLKTKAKEKGLTKAHKRKFETIYSGTEPAKKAANEKKKRLDKEKRDEEKRKKGKAGK